MGSDDDALLAEQIAYYRAGAAEYDRPYAEREDLQGLLAVADGLARDVGRLWLYITAVAVHLTVHLATTGHTREATLPIFGVTSAPDLDRRQAAGRRDHGCRSALTASSTAATHRRGARRPSPAAAQTGQSALPLGRFDGTLEEVLQAGEPDP